jgi:hypothetical protein
MFQNTAKPIHVAAPVDTKKDKDGFKVPVKKIKRSKQNEAMIA